MSKTLEESENLKKLQKISKNHFFFNLKLLNYFFCGEKEKGKCYSLSFSILGIKSSTRALQSSLFQNPGGVA